MMRILPEEYGRLTPEILLRAYAAGIFPMAKTRTDPAVFWVQPQVRGILPLAGFHLPHRLARTVRRKVFEVRCDTAFEAVIRSCGEAAAGRDDTWINGAIIAAYTELHRLGFAHSVECWRDGRLAGGLYGVSVGAAFFGESMFTRVTDASKVALVHLVACLRRGGYRLLDVQFLTTHLKRFGGIEVSRRVYLKLLAEALAGEAVFHCDLAPGEIDSALTAVLQSSTQTS